MTDNKRLAHYRYAINYQAGRIVNDILYQKINTIGIIVHHLENYFTISALTGIREKIAGSGYELIIADSQESIEKEAANARLLFESGVAGLIVLLTARTICLDHFEAFKEHAIPTVFFDQATEDGCNNRVIINEATCSYEATEHLIRQGCKNIAIVTSGPCKNANLQRYRGYLAALEKYGIQDGLQLFTAGDDDTSSGICTAGQIIRMNPRPDGLFFTNDIEAVACMHTLKEAGIRIPEDIAIVGFNNDPISRLVSPALTTIDYPGYEVGKVAAEGLLNQLNKLAPAGVNTTIVPAKLIIRTSSLKVPNAAA